MDYYEIRESCKYLLPQPKKGLGQHFLKSRSVAEKIASWAWEEHPQMVLEIGPGRGDLTFALAKHGPVVAVEIDQRLKPFWNCIRKKANINIVWQDIFNLKEQDINPPTPYSVASNLPYYIATTIVTHLVKHFKGWSTGVFMFQREVAERIKAKPGTRLRGSLSVWIQNLFEVEKSFIVPRGAFTPPPKVTSEVLKLKRRTAPLCTDDIDCFERLLKIIFANKRKNIRNNLRAFFRDYADILLTEAGIDGKRRAEQLENEEICRLYKTLSAEGFCQGESHP
jgi:16S rRNA (adenine1518-N6/adenine1519-N6)-dimethyltransferase